MRRLRYAAALHRDSHNVSVSMTKSFGQFSGGRLMYFPDDDGTLADVRKLPSMGAAPVALDTRNALCMFDGARGHFVEDFAGTRYSLVFFTQPSYETTSRDAFSRLQELGASLPTEASMKHFERLIAPA